MNDFPDIINSQIVTESYDVFWQDANADLKAFEPKPVLIVSTPFNPGSSEEILLKKMLQACQLQPEDYHIIQFGEDTRKPWHLIRDHLKVRSILLLGVGPDALGVSAQLMPHQLARFNGCNWIVTGTLDQLTTQQEIKAHLWQYGLKPAFLDKVYG